MEDTFLEIENEGLKKKLEDRQNYCQKVVNETVGFREEFEESKSEVELLAEEERLLKEKIEQFKGQKSHEVDDEYKDEENAKCGGELYEETSLILLMYPWISGSALGYQPQENAIREAFSDYVLKLNCPNEKAKFSVELKKVSTVSIPRDVAKKHFFSWNDYQTVGTALEVSKARKDDPFHSTVFGYTDKLWHCLITQREPGCIFQGLDGILDSN